MATNQHFEIVEQTLEARLRKKGVAPRIADGWVETGYPGLRLQRGDTQALGLRGRFSAHVEVHAAVDHPSAGTFTISDMVSASAGSGEDALALCVDYYMDVTFPAIQALFDEGAPTGMRNTLASINFEGVAVNWKVFGGELQILQEPSGGLSEVFATVPGRSPIGLMMETMVPVLAQTRLHWCKFYGAQTPLGLTFGVSIDGRKSKGGEAELRRKFPFKSPPRSKWEFRQFLAILPDGTPTERDIQGLHGTIADHRTQVPHQAPAKKSRWPFGKR